MCRDYAHAALTFESRLRFTAYVLAAGSSIGLLFYDRIGVALLCSALLLGGAAPAVSRRALCAFLGSLSRQTDDRGACGSAKLLPQYL